VTYQPSFIECYFEFPYGDPHAPFATALTERGLFQLTRVVVRHYLASSRSAVISVEGVKLGEEHSLPVPVHLTPLQLDDFIGSIQRWYGKE
jgi:hypothetical protein